LVYDHALSASILLGRGTEALVTTGLTSASIVLARLLADDVKHAVLEGLLVLAQTVLLPGVVKDAMIEVMSLHATLEVLKALAIVGLLLEFEPTAVLHELAEFTRVSTAKLFEARLNLLFLDVVVLFVLGASRKALPRQLTLDEVNDNMADSLEIVTTRLLNTFMRCNGGIPGRAGQVLSILPGDVLALRVLVALGKTEVNDVNVVARGI